ncbi:MAG TPA: hypothetical protein VFW65_26885 [Pseudonocardiaceae bacterium]|nr:hypothetical protein [Pseudonocardiaceae bacterium]
MFLNDFRQDLISALYSAAAVLVFGRFSATTGHFALSLWFSAREKARNRLMFAWSRMRSLLYFATPGITFATAVALSHIHAVNLTIGQLLAQFALTLPLIFCPIEQLSVASRARRLLLREFEHLDQIGRLSRRLDLVVERISARAGWNAWVPAFFLVLISSFLPNTTLAALTQPITIRPSVLRLKFAIK